MAILQSVALLFVASVLPASSWIEPCGETRLGDVGFLVGEWQIEDMSAPSRARGRSTVTRVAGQCAVLETIQYPDGYEEVRLLTLDEARGVWQLAIVDSVHGNTVSLEGHRTDDRLEFISTHQRSGSLLVDRVSFIDRAPGWLVRIESADGYGEPWRVVQEVAYSPAL